MIEFFKEKFKRSSRSILVPWKTRKLVEQQREIDDEDEAATALLHEQHGSDCAERPVSRNEPGVSGVEATGGYADGERRKIPIHILERTERTLSLPSAIIS